MRTTILACLASSALLVAVLPNGLHAASQPEGSLSILQRQETIRISEEGRIYVGDRETALRQLASRLRREGVAQSDTVYVSIPDETPRRVMVAVSRELASKGFRRVIFTKPPRAIAEAVPER